LKGTARQTDKNFLETNLPGRVNVAVPKLKTEAALW